MGAEIGNSTQKLHARGPIGLRELCSFKYLVEGSGHVRAVSAPGRSVGALTRADRHSGRNVQSATSGHLVCAQEAYLQLGLDRVTLIPARIPPHKPVDDEPGAEHRLELCRAGRRAMRTGSTSRIWRSRREGPSYTVDTLEFCILESRKRAVPDRRRRHRRRPAEVARARAGAVARHARGGEAPRHPARRGRRGAQRTAGGERARFFRMPTIGVSSTVLRRRVRAGQPIRYYVPDAVVELHRRHRLYAG